MSPQEYRANARQCRTWAEQASHPANRRAFLELAEGWEAAAQLLEQSAAFHSGLARLPVMN